MGGQRAGRQLGSQVGTSVKNGQWNGSQWCIDGYSGRRAVGEFIANAAS